MVDFGFNLILSKWISCIASIQTTHRFLLLYRTCAGEDDSNGQSELIHR